MNAARAMSDALRRMETGWFVGGRDRDGVITWHLCNALTHEERGTFADQDEAFAAYLAATDEREQWPCPRPTTTATSPP